MKKITLSLAVMAIAAASCQKPETALPVTGKFIATVESFDSPTKTSMTPEKYVVWSQNDRLAIFQGGTVAYEYKVNEASAGTVNGTFSRVISLDENDFFAGTELPCNVAFYPYAADLTLTGATLEDKGAAYSIEGVVLPAEQIYSAGSFGNGSFPMAAVTENLEDHTLIFKNILGALKLQLKGTQTVKSIKVTGKNNEILSGTAVVTAYTNNLTPAITMTASDEASKSVTHNCGDGVQLSEGTATDFIIALPPTEFTQGFTVTVIDSQSQTYTIETDKANEVLRSSILAMPAVTLGEELNGNLKNYVDEYGINHGPGVQIDETVWAPVNCGYHATDYPYGKLYQWGRKYGQGYDESDASYPSGENFAVGPVSLSEGQAEENATKFYLLYQYPYDWLVTQNNGLWNAGTEDAPVKTVYDPCPTGWRVPTYDELDALSENYSSWTTNGAGQNGYYFAGEYTYMEDIPQVFFPAAGYRDGVSNALTRGSGGSYWSSGTGSPGAYYLGFYSSNVYMSSNIRAFGYSVRCVQDDGDGDGVPVDHIDISLDMLELTLMPGSSYALVTEVVSETNTVDDIVWTSSAPSVAEVSSGTVTAISDGYAFITASIGNFSAICSVTVKTLPSVTVKNYVADGVDYGPGINIGGTVWAPVNCGYEPANGDYKGYPYGKLYQWGRKYGQGYDSNDATYPSGENLVAGPVMLSAGKSEDNADVFFFVSESPYDWCNAPNYALWNSGTEDAPVKTETDPCPDGWRVPTYNELYKLQQNSLWTTNDDGQYGRFFRGEYTLIDGTPKVFFPAAGYRGSGGGADLRGRGGYYWSSDSLYPGVDYLYFNSSNVDMNGGRRRAFGYSVRCVQE